MRREQRTVVMARFRDATGGATGGRRWLRALPLSRPKAIE
jgi:hypothetical protein